jgi:hypothetical protein
VEELLCISHERQKGGPTHANQANYQSFDEKRLRLLGKPDVISMDSVVAPVDHCVIRALLVCHS